MSKLALKFDCIEFDKFKCAPPVFNGDTATFDITSTFSTKTKYIAASLYMRNREILDKFIYLMSEVFFKLKYRFVYEQQETGGYALQDVLFYDDTGIVKKNTYQDVKQLAYDYSDDLEDISIETATSILNSCLIGVFNQGIEQIEDKLMEHEVQTVPKILNIDLSFKNKLWTLQEKRVSFLLTLFFILFFIFYFFFFSCFSLFFPWTLSKRENVV